MPAMTAALPQMNTDGQTSANTDRTFRKFMAGLWLPDIVSNNPLAVRPGVIPHNWDANGCTSLRVQQQTTAAMKVDVLAGPAVIERTGQGPYFAFTESTAVVNIATSSPSNPRIDVVYAMEYDQASINTDLQHGPWLDVLTGTPAATPVAPTGLPDGAQALAQIAVAANATQITAANITDVRKGTCPTGGVRRMLAGDKVSDPGRVDGELRYRRAVSPLPALLDYWDAAQGLWRGTQGFVITAKLPGTPNSASIVSGSLTTKNTILAQITVPDPGFPYRLAGSATVILTSMSGGSNPSANLYLNANANPLVSTILNSADGQRNQLDPSGNTIFTGQATVKLAVDLVGSTTSGTWGGDVRNTVNVEVIPA